MSIGFPGIPSSIAGVPLAQSKGPEVDRVTEDVRAHQRLKSAAAKAEAAAGVGPADGEDHHASQGGADGQCPWDEPPPSERNSALPERPLSKDPLGQRGELLDLSG
jgi:hypothetical protein